MRLVKKIPHDRYLIEIHEYNSKYILNITLDAYEQIYKIPIQEISSLERIEDLINEEFLSKNLKRFVEMRQDWTKLNQK
ncbi:MAG: hypothetical protein CL824_02825 [Crocinitomicaceae bacterium]|nr:hypothetical protein [Crocinitomicaceae bacterium]